MGKARPRSLDGTRADFAPADLQKALRRAGADAHIGQIREGAEWRRRHASQSLIERQGVSVPRPAGPPRIREIDLIDIARGDVLLRSHDRSDERIPGETRFEFKGNTGDGFPQPGCFVQQRRQPPIVHPLPGLVPVDQAVRVNSEHEVPVETDPAEQSARGHEPLEGHPPGRARHDGTKFLPVLCQIACQDAGRLRGDDGDSPALRSRAAHGRRPRVQPHQASERAQSPRNFGRRPCYANTLEINVLHPTSGESIAADFLWH